MINKLYIILFVINSFGICAQKGTLIQYQNLKKQCIENNIDFDKVGVDETYILNDSEIKILELLNNDLDKLKNKRITFITGSAGRTICKKNVFFKSFKSFFALHRILSYKIIKLNKKRIELSNTDYIVYFQAKTSNPKSKKLLNKIKSDNRIYNRN